MPQPLGHLKKPTYTMAPKCILTRPKCAALIGAIASEWAYVEWCLLAIFDLAHSGTDGMVQRSNPVAKATFATITSFPPKVDLVENILRLCIPSLADEFKAMRPDLRKAYNYRNKAVHTAWHITEELPDDLVTLDLNGDAYRYTEKDFDDILERIMPARNLVHSFLVKMSHAPRVEPVRPKP